MAEQFLTLMADFDDETQKLFTAWYAKLEEAGFCGTQTKGIPYHISLGTFATEKEAEAAAELHRLAAQFAPVPVEISHLGMFGGGNVLFGSPDVNARGLLRLHDAIALETCDQYGWTPHATILIDDADTVCKALPVLLREFRPFTGTITRLHLCAFWPTREIAAEELHGTSGS